MSDQRPAMLALIEGGVAEGGFQTDDVLATVLPLFRQTLAAHEGGFVAPLDRLEAIEVTEEKRLRFAESRRELIRQNKSALAKVEKAGAKAVQIVGKVEHSLDLDTGAHTTGKSEAANGETVSAPTYIAGYKSWEIELGHHDEVTDVFLLGLILGSFACGLDLTREEEHSQFVQFRTNLFLLNPRLNPVVASIIVQMTELNRHRRAQDLRSLIGTLDNYRDQPADLNLNRLVGDDKAGDKSTANRRKLILGHLRDRLFDLSRRNRLIHFKQTAQTLNLTVASVPLLLDYQNIRPEQLFFWHTGVAAAISAGESISLQKYLRFEDAPYLPSVLDKILSEARRDRAEYGFAQLRLVLCFLRWHNLKENPNERIHSPLLLLPVELSKKRGIRDSYLLEPSSSEAEVNPALRHYLHQLYGLELPEMVDLHETTLDQFYETLRKLIQASEPAVTFSKIEKPQIQLVHERARQRLAQFKRKNATLRRPGQTEKPAYSYNREHFKPLGLELFLRQIKPLPAALRDLAGGPPAPRLPNILEERELPGPVAEMSREKYALREGETQMTGNPYQWEFDVCSLTLANFNYRKMTLVRDYSRLLEAEEIPGPFDRVFSLEPRPAEEVQTPRIPLNEQFPVIACDATQSLAIARARTGLSYIIQGPPGTGKSQTITNLIADYVARGKRVLFVCEKRAAIDVVFYRLRQQGLDELCCLIHDSQTDKKAFIQNLKQTSEQWIATGKGGGEAESARAKALKGMEAELATLKQFSETMTSDFAGLPLRELVERLVSLREHLTPLPPRDEEWLPPYRLWLEHGGTVNRLHGTLVELGEDPCFARHPFRWLNGSILNSERPLDELLVRLDKAEALLEDLDESLGKSGFSEELWDTLSDVETILDFAVRLEPLRRQKLIGLLDEHGELGKVLSRLSAEQIRESDALEKARVRTQHWRNKLTATDAEAALAQATRWAKSAFKIFNPGWWRLRRVLKDRYDFTQHAIEPEWTVVLEDLVNEWKIVGRLSDIADEARRALGRDDVAQLAREMADINKEPTGKGAVPGVLKVLRQTVLANPEAESMIERLAALHPRFVMLLSEMESLFNEARQHGFDALAEAIRDVRECSDLLPELLPILTEMTHVPEPLTAAMRKLELAGPQFEAAMGKRTLDDTLRRDRTMQRFDSRTLKRRIEALEKYYGSWLAENAATVRARVRNKFIEHVAVSALSAAKLDAEQKTFKKNYVAGRRELEHEFGKTMRIKSIRDLADGNSGEVIRDLKPIWLMSPLSVSDTLPLEHGLFDVVIFDEASQIPVEEAVPALFRAEQVIVVGDEMQLPPTNFFTAARTADEDELAVVEEEGERIEVSMDADSFLAQSARNLPSTLLAWHYRSRYESLISFSNAAFYSGSLYTIPDRLLPRGTAADISVNTAEEGRTNAALIVDRSISFHLLAHGRYESRRNAEEASYIAELVRELLHREVKLSIGIVAFSEAQQTEIEGAIEILAEEDKEFASRYEAELTREENDQFCGLFVKNLENVQGDERDIIILSICYGPDASGKMLMNFGPINQRGGEKRLNVIFSRARHHMVVVSSIRHHSITNEYNDGANALKNFLNYAEAISRGDSEGARRVLENLNPVARESMQLAGSAHPATEQLAAALRERGYKVNTQVGQSRFRVDLAVAKSEDPAYALGILIDSEAHYANSDLMERYLLQPTILRAFGWEPLILLARDWFAEPELVVKRIERILSNTVDEPENPAEANEIEAQTQMGSETLKKTADAEPTAPNSSRRFELNQGTSRKFWEIIVEDRNCTVTYGRIGTAGQKQTKTYPTPERAETEAKKLIAEKSKKGYMERSR